MVTWYLGPRSSHCQAKKKDDLTPRGEQQWKGDQFISSAAVHAVAGACHPKLWSIWAPKLEAPNKSKHQKHQTTGVCSATPQVGKPETIRFKSCDQMIFVCRNGHGHSSDSDAAVAGNGVFSHARGRLTFFELGSMADREQILRATSATQSWLATRD